MTEQRGLQTSATDPDVAAAMVIFDRLKPLKDALGVKVLPPDNWHITLKFLGEVPEEKMKRIEAALSEVSFAPFAVSLSGGGAFPNNDYPRAIWVGGESQECIALAEKVESALAGTVA